MSTQQDAGTKARLLCAAREIFADKGPRESTVRDICARAGANVAAVNYHFGGKEKLYMAVLEDYLRRCFETYPTDMGAGPEAGPQERLRAYVRSLLYRLMGNGDPVDEKLGQMLTTEIVEPSEHFGELALRYLMPAHDALLAIVQDILPQASARTVKLCAAGVTGHCLLYDHVKQLIRRLRPEMTLESLGVEAVADFVYRFTSAGIASMATEP